MPLVFPGSSRRKIDGPVDPNELTFRDGKRSLPPHLVVLMSGIDTVRFTFDDALDLANKNAERNVINTAFDGVISTHFREGGR